jgi:hypothetical protein
MNPRTAAGTKPSRVFGTLQSDPIEKLDDELGQMVFGRFLLKGQIAHGQFRLIDFWNSSLVCDSLPR